MFPVAQYETHESVIPFLSAVGKYVGNGPCFATASTTKSVCVFDTAETPELAKSYVNAGQKVNCITTVTINGHDHVVIGTEDSLLVFNVEENSQLFKANVPSGVTAVLVSNSTNIIYAGTDCAISGYDFSGNEVFWTVAGDIVTALCEITFDNYSAIIAASDEMTIRLFVGEDSKREAHIHSRCVLLKPCDEPNCFIAAFADGTIAMYKNMHKVWSNATQDTVVGIALIDFSGKHSKDIVVGYSDGLLAFIDPSNGQVMHREQLDFHLASIDIVDIRNDGHMFLMIMSTNGSVRVFMPKGAEGLGQEAKKAFELRENQPKYVQEKAKLLMREYELTKGREITGTTGMFPDGLRCSYNLGRNLEKHCIELTIQTEPPTPIQGTVIECPTTANTDFVVFDANNPPQPTHRIPLWLPVDVTGVMKFEVFVAGVSAPFTINFQKFYQFSEVKDARPSGFAEFEYPGDMFAQFVAKNFVTSQDLSAKFRVCFADVEPLVLSSDGKKCKIECEKVSTAASIASEFCDFANEKEFGCKAHFPSEIDALMEAVKKGGEMKDTKSIQKAEIAGLIAQVKDTIVRIENSEMIEHYGSLYDSVLECERLNAELAREHVKRITNKDVLGGGDKKVNGMIRSFAELRRGNSRNVLLQLCHKYLQSHDYSMLPYILEEGHDVVSK